MAGQRTNERENEKSFDFFIRGFPLMELPQITGLKVSEKSFLVLMLVKCFPNGPLVLIKYI
jgi:hypothetical protein